MRQKYQLFFLAVCVGIGIGYAGQGIDLDTERGRSLAQYADGYFGVVLFLIGGMPASAWLVSMLSRHVEV